jgi:hypothetical protein
MNCVYFITRNGLNFSEIRNACINCVLIIAQTQIPHTVHRGNIGILNPRVVHAVLKGYHWDHFQDMSTICPDPMKTGGPSRAYIIYAARPNTRGDPVKLML